MACLLTTGRKIPCKSAFGGIKTVYFADFGSLTAIAIDATTKEATVTGSRDNGTTFYTQTLNLTLTFLEAKTQAELQTLAVARPYVVVEDYYGNSFLCGYENGMECTGGTVVTGAAAGDLSGFTLTFEGMEETAPYFLAAAVTPDATQIDPTATAP